MKISNEVLSRFKGETEYIAFKLSKISVVHLGVDMFPPTDSAKNAVDMFPRTDTLK